jgi:hypothetical protein
MPSDLRGFRPGTAGILPATGWKPAALCEWAADLSSLGSSR